MARRAPARMRARHLPRRDPLAAEIAAAIGAVERSSILEDIAAGLSPEWASRSLHPHEIAARVSFAAIDQAAAATTSSLTARLAADRRSFSLLLLEDLRRAGSGAEVLERLQRLGPVVPLADIPGMADLLESSRREYLRLLADHAQAAALRAGAEAAAQGAQVATGLTEGARARLAATAERLATAPHLTVVGALRDFAATDPLNTSPGAVAERLGPVAEGLSDRPLEDAARSAVASADGLGRQSVAEAGRSQSPAHIYASELLDRATCGPCSLIDGHEYSSLAAAMADYPAGIYRNCEGGVRCRGTLVFVWGDEEPPTLAVPGDRPPPPPPAPAPLPQPELDLQPAAAVSLPPISTMAVGAPPALTEAELAALRRRVQDLRLEVRRRAEAVLADAAETLDALEIGGSLARLAPPPPLTLRRDPIRGLVRERGTGGEWDWYDALSVDEQARLRRNWFTQRTKGPRGRGPVVAEPGGSGVDELVDAYQRAGVAFDADEAIAKWLELTRRHDAALAVRRGKLPSERVFGELDLDGIFGDGTYRVADILTPDLDEAARAVAATDVAVAEEFALRALVRTTDLPAPWEMTLDDYVEEVFDLEVRMNSIVPISDDVDFGPEFSAEDAAVVRRLEELSPPGLEVDPDRPLEAEAMWEIIQTLARRAGLR